MTEAIGKISMNIEKRHEELEKSRRIDIIETIVVLTGKDNKKNNEDTMRHAVIQNPVENHQVALVSKHPMNR